MSGKDLSELQLTVPQFEELASKLSEPGTDFEMYHTILQEYKCTLYPVEILEPIITGSQNIYARIQILNILKEILSRIWDLIDSGKKSKLKTFFFNAVATIEYGPDNDPESSFEISCLIEILKKEWADDWPEFSRLLIQRAKADQGAPINCINLFKFLTEDIKETINSGIPILRHRELEKAIINDSPLIISYISDILTETTDPILIKSGFECLKVMLKYTNVAIVTNQVFINSIKNLFANDLFKDPILSCFAVIPKTKYQDLQLPKIVEGSFSFMFELLSSWIDDNFNFYEFCKSETDLPHSLSLCLTEYLRYGQYRILLYITYNQTPFYPIFQWLLNLFAFSQVPTYDICLEFWEEITKQMVRDSSEIRLSKHLIHALIKIAVEKVTPPPQFPFKQYDTNEMLFNALTSLIHNLSIIDSEFITKVVTEAIMHQSGEELFCRAFAFGAMSCALPEPLKIETAHGILQHLLTKATELQDFAISLLIVAPQFVQYLKNNLEMLQLLLKYTVEWPLGATDSPEFQLFSISALDKICSSIPQQCLQCGALEIINNSSQIASGICPECHPPLFHAITSIIHAAPSSEKNSLIDAGYAFTTSNWNEAVQNLDTIEPLIFKFSVLSLSEIIAINDPDMKDLIRSITSNVMDVFHSIPSDDNPRNRQFRDAIFEFFEKVAAKSDTDLAGDVVSCIVQDYSESYISYRYPQALRCFATFVRKVTVDNDLTLNLCAEVITSTAETIIDSGEECPDVEISVFELIKAAVACASSLEVFDTALCLPLEQVVEWGLGRKNTQTVSAALNTICLIVDSPDNPFSLAFLNQYFLQLCGSIIEAMIPTMDMALLTQFTRTMHSMMSLQSRVGVEDDSLTEALAGRIQEIAQDIDQNIIQDFAGAIVSDYVDIEKLQTHMVELVNELRCVVFKNEIMRQQYGLEGGFLLSAPYLVNIGSVPEIQEF
ncbi:hypothetical protein TVAG_351330 [Trichomonas vaginalis G3]|uniref:Importin N-terminal domain-containing protein n=1 Tax=Trichomonas vaginalis (strain ATCC PRA-98 / G3) TaxID=412133 RepID=A2DZL7_TRIV3|nr:nuclear export signal receptor protein [Trichomonas vaginalis G3]EAY14085.1 hypothetical protein TVAG_351330 [Trichomonas vaginalis G3]KAI5525095.1 nuclear export signal receptor protein [Trichomonas vaginalis G3]|eukprot:XP_001326308.1 hypothetical protein [Trichomonas vaginalis G3]